MRLCIFADLERFWSFIGYPRSGHSLIGSLINAHPDVVVCHELDTLGTHRIESELILKQSTQPTSVPKLRCLEEKIPPQHRHLLGHENLRRAVPELAAIERETGIPPPFYSTVAEASQNPSRPECRKTSRSSRRTKPFRRHLNEQGLPGYRHQ